MVVVDKHGHQFSMQGKSKDIQGRLATIKSSGMMENKIIKSVTTVDSDTPTMAEQKYAATLLSTLQGQTSLFQNPFFQTIWPNETEIVWPETFTTSDETHPITYQHPLNTSQKQAVETMLASNNSSRVVIIQGPPGTGKTTVIGAYVVSAVDAGQTGIWLLAQSNVAVKNIAEKLIKVGFSSWKLLVSKDFHVGW